MKLFIIFDGPSHVYDTGYRNFCVLAEDINQVKELIIEDLVKAKNSTEVEYWDHANDITFEEVNLEIPIIVAAVRETLEETNV